MIYNLLNSKLSGIITNYYYGNKKQAAKSVRALNKVQLVTLLACSSELSPIGWEYSADNQYNLERFVLLAVEKYI